MRCTEITNSLSNSAKSSINSSISVISQAPQSYSEEFAIIQCFWLTSDLTTSEFVVYAFVVPTFAFFGLCANFISFIVFMKAKMAPSAFSYLAILSWLDCVSCVLITLTCLSRSILQESRLWLVYDFQWQTPMFSITTGAANLILACVSLDRLIYLRCGTPNGTPKFCRRVVARSLIMAVLLFSILLNIPYFWVFVVNDDGTFETTEFYFHQYYLIHNWLTFVLLTLLPAVFLMAGNTAILIAFSKWTKQIKKCQSSCPNSNNTNSHDRHKHQMKLTVTIVLVITLYLVGDLPADLTSRKCIVSLLYGGDITKVDLIYMQRIEVICITLNAIHLSVNIIVYALINRCFIRELFSCLRGASDICFRFMGIMAVTRCCRKCYHSYHRKNIYNHSKHIKDLQHNKGDEFAKQSVSDASYRSSNAKSVHQEKLAISVICQINSK